jgi:hypothetical protein
LHTKTPIDHRVAQTPGEKRDVSAKMRDALQQFVPRCVFRATCPVVGAIIFQDLKHPAIFSL